MVFGVCGILGQHVQLLAGLGHIVIVENATLLLQRMVAMIVLEVTLWRRIALHLLNAKVKRYQKVNAKVKGYHEVNADVKGYQEVKAKEEGN